VRIDVIAPPYTIPPSGYGGIEWVVSLLADGLTEAGGLRLERRLVQDPAGRCTNRTCNLAIRHGRW
jgi:hypothetical protein